jgi:hypothetical protein
MSCYEPTRSSLTVLLTGPSGRRHQSVVARVIVAFFDAFHEALEMRRAAYRRYHLSDD